MLELLQVLDELKPAIPDRRMEAAFVRRRACMGDAIRLLRERRGIAGGAATSSAVTSCDVTLQTQCGPLGARIYTPGGPGPHPVVLYFHGGGWATGSIDTDDAPARGIAFHAGAVVVSVNYRLAPEHRFPSAWEDALAAYLWVLDCAASFDGDGARVALAGEGAGGHLALATAVAARDAGLALPRHVLAISPVTQTSTNTASYLENAIARPLGRTMMLWYFEQLVTVREQLRDPRLQLVQADLTGLPPVTLITARIDPLRSDAEKLHDALLRARVPVEWRDYAGVTNGFFGAADLVDKARQAQLHAGERLAAALAAPAPAPSQRQRFRELTAWLRRLLPELNAVSPEAARASLRG
jgi:acetyl esterase/lipase